MDHVNLHADASTASPAKRMPDDPHQALWVAIVRGSTALVAAMQAESKAAGFPPLEWYDVLWMLERAPRGALRPFELEAALLIPQYNVSRLVSRMEKAGYLEKRICPVDGRGQFLAITESGSDLRRRMWMVYKTAFDRHLGTIYSREEAETLADLLQRLW